MTAASWPARRPDGVLVRADEWQEALEVELTPKRDRREYDHKLSWYMGQMHYRQVHWFVPSTALRERLTRVANELRLDDVVRVTPLPYGLDYPPGERWDQPRGRPRNSAVSAGVSARRLRCDTT